MIGNGFIMNWYYHSKVGIDIIYFWKQILKFTPALILPIILGILFNYLFDLNHILNFLTFGFIYVLVLCTSFWVLGMNKYEKELIGKPIRHILKKK